MNSPFNYGQIADGVTFTNRLHEVKQLGDNFKSLTNTVLISPRRWGKSSLVKHTANEVVEENKKYRVCWFDMFKVQTEEEFYHEYSKAVVKSASSKITEWMSLAGNLLSALTPKLSVSAQPDAEMDFELKFAKKAKAYETIFDLPEQLALKNKVKIIVCLDEFQNIEKFGNPLLFQQRLRAHWQHHKNVVYCVFGSKRHMMMELFGSRSMPFYKFGDLMTLGKISTNHWVPYVTGHFRRAGKKIKKHQVEFISETVQEHPYYVQQLSEIVWYKTDDEVTDDILKSAVSDLIIKNQMLFQRDYDQLTEYQVNLLKALASGEEKLTSKDTMSDYNLGTSASVLKNIKALEKKEMIDSFGKKNEFVDPVFELWFKRLYRIY